MFPFLRLLISEVELMKRLSHIWSRIQGDLFPGLNEILDPLTKKQEKLVAILEVLRIEDYIPPLQHGLPGRPKMDRQAIVRAFVAKAIYNLPTTRTLIEQLNSSPNLRRLCGWEKGKDIPSEAVFSRTFAEFAETELPQRVHSVVIEEHEKPRIVGHISRDGTAIEAREKPASKSKKKKADKPKRKRGRPKKGEKRPPKEPTRLERQASGMTLEEMVDELPKVCDVGCKKNSKGQTEKWIGYGLHVDWADGGIPVSCILTSASLHDSQVAIPLAETSNERLEASLYDVMDAAYDAKEIKDHSLGMGHVPLIDPNPRRGEKREMDPAEKLRYNERSTAERGFGRLKDEFGGRMVRVRGHAKVMAHLMFGILALTADQLLRLVV